MRQVEAGCGVEATISMVEKDLMANHGFLPVCILLKIGHEAR
jgi:hypothetical protein